MHHLSAQRGKLAEAGAAFTRGVLLEGLVPLLYERQPALLVLPRLAASQPPFFAPQDPSRALLPSLRLILQFETGPPPPRHHDETPPQRRMRLKKERIEANKAQLIAARAACTSSMARARAQSRYKAHRV